jgi:predicted transposase YbfD/YdcC
VTETFLAQLAEKKTYQLIALDGKTSRGTITVEDSFGLHPLTAYLPEVGIALKHLPVEKEKENEIMVAPNLLESLNLENAIVLGDAMQIERALSSQILNAGGDFVWIVKDNQPTVRQDIEFGATSQMNFQTAKTVDKNRGRLEERTITLSNMLNDYIAWPFVQ